MRFGLFAMPEHPPIENWSLSYDRDIDEIVLAEKLGFSEFWIGEHHTGGYENVPMPELLLAKASALTSRIRLGTGVVNLPYQDPFQVAERLAFLDHLTHGRLEYGFGGGGLPTDQALFQLERSEAAPRTAEALEIIWQLLTSDEPVTYEGVYWKYENRQLQVGPYQDVPPFAIAGLTGTHNYARCGAKGWKALSVYFAPGDNNGYPNAPDLAAHAAALVGAAQENGLDPDLARQNWRITREVYVSDSKDQAMKEIREGVHRSYEYLLGLGLGALMKKGEGMDDAELTFEWMVEEIPWIIGSPEDCTRQIRELEEVTGGFGTFLINSRDWVTTDKWNRSLELFARYVTPQFTPRENMARRNRLARTALGV
ncbi:LLM class flavin-dependent oxidoreductase [Gordonia sp. zg691]|uniref:LLM class flavin-dependent oxidoreductase n=1 Tax=Gordonia jinghuaiqii TaxID=2758710 RepID=A0A7D7LY19_9ACTN|nr:LLM class flavin-dependent oxidoreductase [Gordonia jinghuaiqii]MBD0863843.1 LLM class flavin-dependent oxidoreductase [Gordonia jinghuaiqii]MCR5979935.1 LLM class flavin-dependent oxidoreductase [Gordonia jinghuaiqii]QMT03135.1 LLM class flavin-dependent oxidoreductase [Gordonia jinghuaiqii]